METKIKRIAFTSDGKRKSTQKTLRNLLADQLTDNNFISLQSQRIGTALRPSTMYNDRVRKQLYPQNPVKLKKSIELRLLTSKQENRLVRNKSEHLRQLTPNQQKAEKQYQSSKPIWVSKQEKTKMKKCLGNNQFYERQVAFKQIIREDQPVGRQIISFNRVRITVGDPAVPGVPGKEEMKTTTRAHLDI